MEEIAVLKACLVRPTVNHPWGFRLKGGADIGQPIRINAVLAGSPAAAIGLVADDEVTEVEGQPTANMTHSQALEAIGRLTGETLYLTVERKAKTSVPHGPEVEQTHVSPKTYEPLDNVSGSRGRTTKVHPDTTPVSQPIHGNLGNIVISSSSPSPFATSEPERGTEGIYTAARNQRRSLESPYSPREPAYNVPHGSGTLPHQVGNPPGNSSYYPPGPSRTPFEFQTVQSRPFVEPVSHRRPHSHPSSQPVTAPLPPTPPPPPEALLPVDTGGGFEEVSLRSDYSTQLMNDLNEVPQSRTFKILESIMSNEEPSAGASGLPPPRSAAMERMKREGSTAGSSARVKVLMSQKYNSPLGMYSAKNLIETFAVQAENAIETLEKQNPALPEHEPVYASRH